MARSKRRIYRQGDVFLHVLKKNEVPEGLKKHETKVLAYGEATGHRHEVTQGDVFVDEDGKLYVKATKGSAELSHMVGDKVIETDHKPITIQEDEWMLVVPQEQYTPEGWERAAD